jgi:hypothetical protein
MHDRKPLSDFSTRRDGGRVREEMQGWEELGKLPLHTKRWTETWEEKERRYDLGKLTLGAPAGALAGYGSGMSSKLSAGMSTSSTKYMMLLQTVTLPVTFAVLL